MLAELVVAAVFLSVALAVWGIYALVAQAPARAQQKVVGYRIESLIRAQERGSRDRSVDVFKQEILTSMPALQRFLLRLPRASSLQRALRQADWRISVPTFALLTAVAAGLGMLFGTLVLHTGLLGIVFAGLGACGPYLFLVYRRRKRLDAFHRQLPDAIDLLCRAVRAGHAVPTGFEMVADEMEAPVAEEFRLVHDEQKFGLPLKDALLNLQERVPTLDVRLLGTAIEIQREVGGNLAEVLDKIAHTIRERIKIRGQVRVYTAQGRMTGYVLSALPIIMGLLLYAMNRTYFDILLHHDYGVFMLGAAALLQLAGFFWIRRVIHIKI